MSRVPLPYLDPQNESLSLLIANPKSWNVMPFLGSVPVLECLTHGQVLRIQLLTPTESTGRRVEWATRWM